jgi:cytochrome c556
MRWRQDHHQLVKTSAQDIKVALAERDEALAKLEPLKKELDQAIAERTPHDYGVLKTQIEHLKQSLHDARIYNSGLAAELERVKAIPRQSGDLNAELSKLVADMNRAHAAQVSPEPSRLEIAAMLLSGFAASDTSVIHNKYNFVLTEADALIAAAKAGGGPGTGVPEYGRYVDGKWVGTPIPQTGQSSGGSGGCSPQ